MKSLRLLTLSFAISLWGLSLPVGAADQEAFDEALAAAIAAQEKAASVSGEWRDVGKFLEEAQKLVQSGDFEATIALAKKAEDQCHRGYEQMTSQAGKVGLEPFLQ